jgi:hypothetical protein
MGETLGQLRDKFENFLRSEVCNELNVMLLVSRFPQSLSLTHLFVNLYYLLFTTIQRFHLVERIATAVDDFSHLNQQTSVAAAGCPRVTISMAELRSADGQLSQAVRLDPLRQMRALEAACHQVAMEERPGYDKEGALQ